MRRQDLPSDRPIKLVSAKGTLLGTVTIPHHWVSGLNNPGGRGHWQFHVPRPVSIQSYSAAQNSAPLVVSIGTLVRHYSYDMHEECLQLYGISLEEFEAVPGCSFAPGAGYLRSVAG